MSQWDLKKGDYALCICGSGSGKIGIVTGFLKLGHPVVTIDNKEHHAYDGRLSDFAKIDKKHAMNFFKRESMVKEINIKDGGL